MKVAVILVSCAVLASTSMALAQTATDTAGAKSTRLAPSKTAHGGAPQSKATDETDRLIDSEQKRMDRVMSICTGC